MLSLAVRHADVALVLDEGVKESAGTAIRALLLDIESPTIRAYPFTPGAVHGAVERDFRSGPASSLAFRPGQKTLRSLQLAAVGSTHTPASLGQVVRTAA
jgi:hypothetical protein